MTTKDLAPAPSPSSGLDWSFARRPRWITGHILVLVTIVLFVNLGLWQLRRLDQRQTLNATVEARSRSPVEPLSALLSRGAGPDDLEYRIVSASGVYSAADEILVRSRSLNGEPGFHVVTPLVDDATVLVNRGFVPLQYDTPPVLVAAPPAGRVEVVGRARQTIEPPVIGPRDPPTGDLSHVYWLDIERLQGQFGGALVPLYLELVSQRPAQPGALPVPLPAPSLDEGPHRSYAVQWFSFALITAIGYGFLLRRAARKPGLS